MKTIFIIIFLQLILSINAFSDEIIFKGDFRDKNWIERFNSPPWTEGLKRTKKVFDPDKKKFVLEVSYPKGVYGNENTGAQWPTYFGKSFSYLKLTYWVKFAQNFDFVRGGKLPGLIGGHRKGNPHSNLTGGNKPDGTDGFSARLMWRKNGRIVQYVYHKDQPGKWGEDFQWRINGSSAKFKPGKWHKITTAIWMNDVGKKNGKIMSWLDDKLALEQSGFEFRIVKNLGIDALYFSTFFGGDSSSWSPTKNETVRFDDFVVVQN